MNRLNSFCALCIIVITIFMVACTSIENYQADDETRFVGHYAQETPASNGQLKVISWNIKFSEKIETAIAELSTVDRLQGADIILLQEMDEDGVQAIAQALHYNYVYFPASIHNHHNRNFGNAVLAKWPLSEAEKFVLPHKNPKNDQLRIATKALVTINGQNGQIGQIEIPTYSVHTETVWLGPGKRTDQIKALTEEMGSDNPYLLIGGDFNSVSGQSIVNLNQHFEKIGLTRVSQGAGVTFRAGGLDFTMDHIYAKGMSVLANGVWSETQASDHFPVWVELLIN